MALKPEILLLGYNAWDVNLAVAPWPARDSKCEVERIRYGGGGPGATAAVALARLGAHVRLVTQLGDDLPAQLQREELTRAGVDLSLSRHLSGHETAKAVIVVHPDSGERTIFWSRGDLPVLAAGAVDPAWLDGADLFYTDGHETEAACVLATEARRRDLPVVMDAGSVREGSAALVATVTDAISSREFAPTLTRCPRFNEALRALQALGPRRVAMTCGPRGVLALAAGKVCHVPAFDVPVVDTTGAGDAFHAGYALARLSGRDFLASLEYGSAVAALKCGGWGGRSALPTAGAVADLLRDGARHGLPGEFEPLLG